VEIRRPSVEPGSIISERDVARSEHGYICVNHSRSLLIVLLAVLLLPGTAPAGTAASWSFEVLEISSTGPGAHRIRLLPRPPGRRFPKSCETLVVHSSFELESWTPEGRLKVTRDGHERSLRLMEQAQITHDIVRFGVVGHGLGAIGDRPKCEVASRGLLFIVDPDGTPAVYSVFEEP
jgi:hypothetical protein